MTRIKKLEISGFKSFAEAVTLEFSPGITMLVGPNGCGKTNVVDAVRWVLGERSALRLRGERMENVIFAGTTRRHPLGMAEVVLSLDSEHDPSREGDFTVSRRVYRDGESTYKLGKTTCRLKDVEEFLIDVGIGSGGYLVIEQDMVDMILSEKPEERRNLLDEAAGIVRYKRRKDEALRKLEATRQNLARVRDVVAEVQARLEILRKQAARTRRARRLSEQIHDLEQSIVLWRGSDVLSRLEELEQKARVAGMEEAKAAAELAQADAAAAEARQKADEAAQILTGKREEFYRFQRELDAMISREELLGERIEHQRQIVASAREELAGNVGQAGAFVSEIVTMGETLTLGQEKFNQAQNDRQEKERALAELEKELGQTRTESEQIEEELGKAQSELATLVGKQAATSANLQAVNATLERLIRERAEIVDKSGQIAADIAQNQGQLTNLTDDVSKAESELAAAQNDMKVLEERELKLKHHQQELIAEKESLTARINSITEDLKRMESPLTVPQDALPPPSRWLEVPPELEIAVAAVIGELLSAPILPDISQLSNAFAELTQKSGWWLWQNPLLNRLQSPPAGLPRLIDKIGFPSEYRDLLESMLGNVLLLDEITPKIVNQLGGDWVGVTKHGIVVNRNSMGYPQAVHVAPELNLRRLLAEAQRVLITKEKVLHDVTREQEEFLTRENKQREKLQTKITLLEDVQFRLREVQAKVQELVELIRRQESRLAAIDGEVTPLLAEKAELGMQMDALSGQKTTLEGAIAELISREASIRLDLKELEQKRETIWQEVLGSRSAESEAGDRLNSITRQLVWVKEQQTKLSDRNRVLEEDANKASAEVEKVTTELVELRLTIKEKSAAQESLAELLHQAEEALSQARSIAASCDDTARQRREAHRVVQDGVGELKALLLLAEAEWANLRERALAAGIEVTPTAIRAQEITPEVTLEKLEEECERARANLGSMGEINYLAEEEFNQEDERNKFLSEQISDLEESEGNLMSTINALDRNSREVLLATLDRVNINFQNIFGRLFEGGEAALVLPQDEDPITGNLEIIARPPGKRTRHINLLSGGEKALSAIALLFALFCERPSPFCILDEIDASLDDANVQRFLSLLGDFSSNTQFLIITHNKRTMEAADSLVGITMGEPGVSSVISIQLADVDNVIAAN